jgi:hypothetical protein
MERVLSADEKIRRAEELYSRKRNQNIRTTSARVNVSEKGNNYKLFKKMILQILICLMIYFIFYLIKNSDYIFSQEVISKAKEILSYDINIQERYHKFMGFINQEQENKDQEDIIPPQEDNINDTTNNITEGGVNSENTMQENNLANEQSSNMEQDTLSITDEQKPVEETSSISQGLLDAQEIKSKYSLIKPLSRGNHF